VLLADPEQFEPCPLGYQALEPGACLESPKEADALVVYLHGMFEPGKLPKKRNEFVTLAEAALPKRVAVLALEGEVGLCNWSKDALKSRCWPNDLSQRDRVPALVGRLDSALRASRGVTGETGRPWLMGFSNGGFGVAMLLSESKVDAAGYVVAHGGDITGQSFEEDRMRPTLLLGARGDLMMIGRMRRFARELEEAKWPAAFVLRDGVHELTAEDAAQAVEFVRSGGKKK